MVRLLSELTHELGVVDELLPGVHDHVDSIEVDDSVGFAPFDTLVVLCDPALEHSMLLH